MTDRVSIYVSVGLGGMIGSGFRYAISLAMPDPLLPVFPWDTIFVNWSGAFLLTLLLFSFFPKNRRQTIALPALTTGLLGSYTTYSTIQLDFFMLMESRVTLAIAYLLFTILGGVVASFIGYRIAQLILPRYEKEGY